MTHTLLLDFLNIMSVLIKSCGLLDLFVPFLGHNYQKVWIYSVKSCFKLSHQKRFKKIKTNQPSLEKQFRKDKSATIMLMETNMPSNLSGVWFVSGSGDAGSQSYTRGAQIIKHRNKHHCKWLPALVRNRPASSVPSGSKCTYLSWIWWWGNTR